MSPKERFSKILRDRSREHSSAIRLMIENELYGQSVSILRQDLDSLVRTVYLLSKDIETREHLINQTLDNVKWTLPNSRTKVTDRDMVDLTNHLNGWTSFVYRLGCAFIHLSPFADYQNSNPFEILPSNEIIDIKQHLYSYHGFNLDDELNIENLRPYLFKVFQKISNNLEAYIVRLENDNLTSLREL